MRHQKKGRKLGLKKGPRKSFLRVLGANLVEHERLITTEARAKEVRSFVERLITYGKKQNLAGLRLLLKKLPRQAAYKIYHDLAIRYQSRKGGYTRIIKLGKRRTHDASKMARIEFV